MAIPNRVRDRVAHGLKQLLPIIQQQKARDVSEADTVTLVKDLLADVFGYDKYTELTSEYAIRGTYCDLAVKLSDKLVQLIRSQIDRLNSRRSARETGCGLLLKRRRRVGVAHERNHLAPVSSHLRKAH